MNISRMNQRVTFQKINEADEWKDFISCYAYINGVNASDFFIANTGGEAALTVTVSCRYQPDLMKITPMQYRIASDGIIYELMSPGDDIMFRHEEVIFRAKRIYTEADGE